MEIIEKEEQLVNAIKNKIVGYPSLDNSVITFSGERNILYCEDGVKIRSSNISFHGNDSVIYLSKSYHDYAMNINIHNNSTCFIGCNNYFNNVININLSEEKNVFIGNGCLLSFGIWIRNADPHLIYDVNSHKRINMSKSVYIGDHVWIGQNVLLLKGTKIGSGSIISANAVLTGKTYESNKVYGGNPARKLKNDIFWLPDCVHGWTKKETNEKLYDSRIDYTYDKDCETIEFDEIEKRLVSKRKAKTKLEVLCTLAKNQNKNRFAINNIEEE